MARWRRLARKGNKLLVCAERTQSTKGTTWSKNLMFAIHPKYRKITHPGQSGYGVQIANSAVFTFSPEAPPPVDMPVKKQVWYGFIDGTATGTAHVHYEVEVEASGTWYKDVPEGYTPPEGDWRKWSDECFNGYGYTIETASSNRGRYEDGVFVPDPIESEEGIWRALADDLDDQTREQKRTAAMSMWYPDGNVWFYHNGKERYSFTPYYVTYSFGSSCRVKLTTITDSISWSDGSSSPMSKSESFFLIGFGVQVRLHNKPGETPWLELVLGRAGDSKGTFSGNVSGSSPMSLDSYQGEDTYTYEAVEDDDFQRGVDWKPGMSA